MPLTDLKVAIVHDILDAYGGAERVVECLLRAFPQADLYTSCYTGNPQTSHLTNANLHTTFMQHLPLYQTFSKFYTPLYPIAFESLDFSDYQLVISSTAHFAKGVLTTPEQVHICYCHTPPRFLYHYATESQIRSKVLYRPILSVLEYQLRKYDYVIAQRPDFFITNSSNTRKRIQKFYRRDADVIYPPVEVERFQPTHPIQKNDYYLLVSRLIPYKNIDLAIKAFNQLELKLKIVGEGFMRSALESIANDNIEFVGFVSNEELVKYYQAARAFIITTSEEDFGITAVESIAAGTPVIALDQGGISETVTNGINGILFEEESPQGLIDAVNLFTQQGVTQSPQEMMEEANKFSAQRFIREVSAYTSAKVLGE